MFMSSSGNKLRSLMSFSACRFGKEEIEYKPMFSLPGNLVADENNGRRTRKRKEIME